MASTKSVDTPLQPSAPAHVGTHPEKRRPTALDARSRVLLQRSRAARLQKEVWFARGIAQHIDDATPWRSGEVPLSMRTSHRADTRVLGAIVLAATLIAMWILQ